MSEPNPVLLIQVIDGNLRVTRCTDRTVARALAVSSDATESAIYDESGNRIEAFRVGLPSREHP